MAWKGVKSMIKYAALTPHPPLIIPEIGGDKIKDMPTVEAMKMMSAELANTQPETIIILTPHGNVFADCITCLGQEDLYGDFRAFGSDINGTSCKNDLALINEISIRCAQASLPFISISKETARTYRLNSQLDHGVLVPLYYINQKLNNEVMVLPISIGLLSNLELYNFGAIIKESAHQLGRRIAVVASGDMSHRLKDEGPYDYHPDGPEFDQQIKKLLSAGDVEGIYELPRTLRENAGECGYPSLLIMLGCLDGWDFKSQVFSYEGPFGVGYLVAGIQPQQVAPSLLEQLKLKEIKKREAQRAAESEPVKWARLVVENYIRQRKIPELPEELKALREQKAGVFVSLKINGHLRGCIGTITPVHESLDQEIMTNAISSATRDNRFLPVSERELEQLTYSVDVLGAAEPCRKEDLDPKKYGVIVSTGTKRGLLLPDLEGVDSVEQQLDIARQKAGIAADEAYDIERFQVTRYL
jgi:AmmeMemoRadiSam system protein A